MIGAVADILPGPVRDILKFALGGVENTVTFYLLRSAVNPGKNRGQMGAIQRGVEVHISLPVPDHDPMAT